MKKFSTPPIAKVAPLPKPAPMPGDLPTRPTLHVGAIKKPLSAEDPQLLEKALLRRMNRFG